MSSPVQVAPATAASHPTSVDGCLKEVNVNQAGASELDEEHLCPDSMLLVLRFALPLHFVFVGPLQASSLSVWQIPLLYALYNFVLPTSQGRLAGLFYLLYRKMPTCCFLAFETWFFVVFLPQLCRKKKKKEACCLNKHTVLLSAIFLVPPLVAGKLPDTFEVRNGRRWTQKRLFAGLLRRLLQTQQWFHRDVSVAALCVFAFNL